MDGGSESQVVQENDIAAITLDQQALRGGNFLTVSLYIFVMYLGTLL